MRRFTAILFIFSLLICSARAEFPYPENPLPENATIKNPLPESLPSENATIPDNTVAICDFPNATSSHWEEFVKGLKLSLKNKKLEMVETENCTRNQISFNNETLTLQDALPSIPEEIEHIIPLVKGSQIAIIYRLEDSLLSRVLSLELGKEGKKIVLDMGFREGENNNYRNLINSLLQLKKNGANVDTLIFIGNYKEATLFVPFFRIFSPSPVVVGTWRISSPYMFSYRKFMKKLVFYDWYVPYKPLMPYRKFCLAYKKEYKTLPSRYAFLGYELGKEMAQSGKMEVKRVYHLIELKSLPRLVPPVRF
ncbi:MAG: hypothetical protein GXO44_01225 [Deferribacteres bacterium]|nr:hypothetical protein [Deferribacteres bacterium]